MSDTPAAGMTRLPHPARLLAVQTRHQVRLLLANGRALAVGLGLPVILLIASKGKHGSPNVAGYAIFGLTITAWSSYGIRLVAAREAGILKRWRATPLPRWCYFAASILASALAGVLAGAITVLAALVIYGPHFDQGPHVELTVSGALVILVALALGGLAWAATATAVTRLIPTVESALPVLLLTYFPVIIISGVLFAISEPHWLSSLAGDLPAQPLVDTLKAAVEHRAGAWLLPVRAMLVLAAWAAGGLLTALAVFQWEPHRPSPRRRR